MSKKGLKKKAKRGKIKYGKSRGKKVLVEAVTTPADDHEDGYMSTDDIEFVEEEIGSGRLNFLTNVKSNSDVTQAIKKRRVTNDGDSEEFEIHPRQPSWIRGEDGNRKEEELHYLLPIKSHKGLIQQQPVTLMKNTIDDVEDSTHKNSQLSCETKEETSDDEEVEEVPVSLSAAEILLRREKKLKLRKAKIADLASRVLEDPQKNISLLNKLRGICQESNPELFITVRKLAIVSVMTVFKDITPGYAIRELSATEKAVKVSKDVRILREYEQSLLSSYQKFLVLLEETVRAGLKDKRPTIGGKRKRDFQDDITSQVGLEGLTLVALNSLSELALSLSHFNYRNNIFGLLVQWMNSSDLEGKVEKACCSTISELFKNDIIGDVSLEIVQQIMKMIKSRGYNVKPAVIKTFLDLQLQNVEEPVDQLGGVSTQNKKYEKLKKKNEVKKMTRKQRRKFTIRNRLQRELRETEAEERKEKKTKLQTDTIKLVFYIYFRILKYSQDSPLMSAVLEGLAKFAHLISIDYFTDLMTVLQSLMETNTLSSRETMQCILTCFEILSGQGESLDIDPRVFYCQLYTNLLHVDFYASSYDVSLALSCLEKMIKKKRQVSNQRVQSFVKRLTTISLHLPPAVALAVMATTRLFIQGYPHQCEYLLEYDDTPCGVFQPHIPDPELSGAQSTLLWELSTLRNHFHPHISSYAEHLVRGAPSQGLGALHSTFSRRSPLELVSDNIWPTVDPLSGINPKWNGKVKSNQSEYRIGNRVQLEDYIKKMSERADIHISELMDGHLINKLDI